MKKYFNLINYAFFLKEKIFEYIDNQLFFVAFFNFDKEEYKRTIIYFKLMKNIEQM